MWAGVFLGDFTMHLISMHNSILQGFPVVLTRTMLLFSDLWVLTHPRTPKDMNCHLYHRQVHHLLIPLEIFVRKLFQNLNILSPLYKRKHKTYFFNNMTIWLSTWVVVTYYGWQMGPWSEESVRRFHLQGKVLPKT